MMGRHGPRLATLLASLLMTACAAPPMTRYTLEGPARAGPTAPLAPLAPVIAVSRVTLPDDLDTQDLLIRRGAVLEPSHSGRWASRLSLGVTNLIAENLARTRPDVLVTDQPQNATPSYRLLIEISRFDLAVDSASLHGTATMEANWQIVPKDAGAPSKRDRIRIDVAGPMRTDGDVVALAKEVVIRLAAAIDITHLR